MKMFSGKATREGSLKCLKLPASRLRIRQSVQVQNKIFQMKLMTMDKNLFPILALKA